MKHRPSSRRSGIRQSQRSTSAASARSGALLPSLPIGLNDLRSLTSVIRGYLAYVRRSVPLSAKQQAQIRTLQSLYSRLLLFQSWNQQEIPIPLTLEELTALTEAMLGFVKLLHQMVPPSQERDGVIASLEGLRQAINHMLAFHTGQYD